MDVGFIGLGAMGRAMADNLIKAGHTVRAWNRSPGPLEALVRSGARRVEPGEAFAGVVVSMLADDDALRELLIGRTLLETAPAETLHINMATISVELARFLTEEHRRRGLEYVGAPVFGRPEAAAARQLHIVAAGSDAALERAQPLLDAMGQRTWRVGGEPAQANAVKLAGNFMIASAIETMAEAAVLVERYGVKPAEMLNVLTNTLFAAPVYKNYGAMIAERRYEPAAFRLALGLKDVRLVLQASDAAKAPMPYASVLRDHFLEAVALGDGDRDWAALAEIARRHAG
jgi:3-hydroxyisobutyrate dehydrogenase-like beta-hydroxyacid dehydrogenase